MGTNPHFEDPLDMSPDERRQRIAKLPAIGLGRLVDERPGFWAYAF